MMKIGCYGNKKYISEMVWSKYYSAD